MKSRRLAASTSPRTARAVAAVRERLEALGYAIEECAADGVGGRAMEAAIRPRQFVGVLDLTLAELLAEMLGRPGGAGPDRLTAAALADIPQVIAPGGLDGITPRQADRLAKE